MTKDNSRTNAFRITRRRFVAGSAIGAAAVTAAGTVGFPNVVRAAAPVKIGYVSPKTGPLAPFAEADEFNVQKTLAALGGEITIAGKTHPLEIIVKDSQSNPNRAAEVANELILRDEVHLMTAANTPETTNPVTDQAEINEVPCVSTLCPWQPYFFGRGGDPATGFDWTYHYFWGLEDVIAVFLNMWGKLETNKSVGGLFPNDGDGNAWGDTKLGFPPVLAAEGYSLTDPGRYQNLTDDFSAHISAFKDADAEIVTGVVLPPDFTTFWTQAAQQGYRPKIASVGKAILFPVAVEAMGDAAHNLSSEVWWSPWHPFASSLTGETAGDLAHAFTAATGKQWTQPVGYVHSLFEVAVDVLKRTEDVGNPSAILAAITSTNLDTVAGHVGWGNGPVKNVAKMQLVGGQWRRTPDGPNKYDLVITANETAPSIPAGGDMQAIS
jgi:branched-chain amino acid transport system substrate-binding protein